MYIELLYIEPLHVYRATSSKIQHNSMLELVLSPISAENFVATQHCENKFKNGTFSIENEFLRSRNYSERFFRLPANTENS